MNRYLTPAVRKWIYGVALAALPLLIGYGVLDEANAALWAALIGAILVPGLALANTPTIKSPGVEIDDDYPLEYGQGYDPQAAENLEPGQHKRQE